MHPALQVLCRGSGQGVSVSTWPGWAASAQGWVPLPEREAGTHKLAGALTAGGRGAAQAAAHFGFLGLCTALPVFGQKGRDRCLSVCL